MPMSRSSKVIAGTASGGFGFGVGGDWIVSLAAGTTGGGSGVEGEKQPLNATDSKTMATAICDLFMTRRRSC
jgi:hypothetical protein